MVVMGREEYRSRSTRLAPIFTIWMDVSNFYTGTPEELNKIALVVIACSQGMFQRHLFSSLAELTSVR